MAAGQLLFVVQDLMILCRMAVRFEITSRLFGDVLSLMWDEFGTFGME